MLRGMDDNIFTQIGLVVLVGMGAKNAVLIVEFAKQQQEHGKDRLEAAIEAATLRLAADPDDVVRLHLWRDAADVATGAGAEMRQAMGTAVFFGMIGVTFFGVFFTPVFYVILRWIGSLRRAPSG